MAELWNLQLSMTVVRTCDDVDEVLLLLRSTLCDVWTVLQHPLEFFISRVIQSNMPG